MGHRQATNSFGTFGNAQNQHQSYIPEQPFTATGRFAAPSGSFVQPGDVLPSGEDQHLNSRSNGNYQYHYSNYNTEAVHFLPQPPYMPFQQLSSYAGNVCIPGSNGYGVGLADHHPSIHRGPFKRKRSIIAGPCERGGSRWFEVGSSSGSSAGMLRPVPGNENIPSNHTCIRHGSSSISINGDDSWRNVRRRYSYASGHDPGRTHHISDYSSVPHQFTTYPANYSGGRSTFGSSLGGNSHPESGGSSHDMNAFYIGGGAAGMSGHHGSWLSTGRERCINYNGRILPPNVNGLGRLQLGLSAPTSTENSVLSAETFSFRNMRSASAEGWPEWCNRVQHGSVGVTNALPSVVDTRDRMRSEVLTFERQSFSGVSRNMFDDYVGMRLDVDSMSYEELLALGDRIGIVNTGLSEDMASKCMTAEGFVSSNDDDKSCAICLEIYEEEEEVGRLKRCGHDYHVRCITKWLSMKNVCPICKLPALKDDEY